MPLPNALSVNDNPLTITHRDGIAKALATYPTIMDIIARAEATGIDLAERKEVLANLKAAGEGILDQFFEGYRAK